MTNIDNARSKSTVQAPAAHDLAASASLRAADALERVGRVEQVV